MSAFSNIPSQAVLPLDAYGLDDLKKASRRADQKLLHVNLSDTRDKKSILSAIAKAFTLPAHFGHNLDALYDCLTDMTPTEGASDPGFVVILENMPDVPGFGAGERNAVLDVFREAADFFFDQKTAFRVFYSVHKTR